MDNYLSRSNEFSSRVETLSVEKKKEKRPERGLHHPAPMNFDEYPKRGVEDSRSPRAKLSVECRGPPRVYTYIYIYILFNARQGVVALYRPL